MEATIIIFKQVVLIFIYIVLGMLGKKRGMLSEESAVGLSNISLFLSTPAVIINSFQRELDYNNLRNVFMVVFLAVIIHLISMLISSVFISKKEKNHAIERFSVIFSNCGYMAIPMIRALLGEIGVYYLAGFIAVFNIFLWTVGQKIMTKNSRISLKKALLTPGIIGLMVGLTLHLLRITLPLTVGSAVQGLAGLNTPLSMITTGIFLANVDLKSIIKKMRFYYIGFLKLFVVPISVAGLLYLWNLTDIAVVSREVFLVVVLASACPSAAATVQFATINKTGESEYAAELVASSTLLSIVSLTAVSFIANALATI